MRTIFVLLMCGSLLLTSCVSLIEPYQKVNVYTSRPSVISYDGITVNTKKNKAKLSIVRENSLVTITTTADTLSNTVVVKPKVSLEWRLSFPENLLDKDSPKKYGYPSAVYIRADTADKRIGYYPRHKKGDLYLHLSVPEANTFLFKHRDELYSSTAGFIGLGAGLDYYYADRNFISLTVATITDFMLPFPAPYDRIGGEYDRMWAMYGGLTNNHRKGRFTFGYGLSFGNYHWQHVVLDTVGINRARTVTDRKHTALGFL
ncbi:MAG: hypothetical protein EOP47_22255, partial [Sphingobacteriaceae bacterium]